MRRVRALGYAVVGSCVFCMFLVAPLTRSFYPGFAVVICQGELDPWGEPWRNMGMPGTTFPYSSGPNRIEGDGDDLVVLVESSRYLGQGAYGTWWYHLVTRPALTLGLFALLVAWLLEFPTCLRAPRRGLGGELALCLTIVMPPMSLLYGLDRLEALGGRAGPVLDSIAPLGPAVIPGSIFAIGSLAFLLTLLALAIRLRIPSGGAKGTEPWAD